METVTRIAALWLVIAAGMLLAQEPATAPAKAETKAPIKVDTKDTLAVLAAAYKADMNEIAPEYEKWFTALQNWYLASLDKLQGESVKAGDLEAVLAFKAERERIAARAETTQEQIQSMPGKLGKLRAAYETALKKIMDEAGRRKDAARGKHLANLDALQTRLTTGGDLDEALLVRKEKDQFAVEMAEAAGVAVAKPAGQDNVELDAQATIAANSPDGYRLGAVRQGDVITLQYEKGLWKAYGHIPTDNPDAAVLDHEDQSRLVIAHAPANGKPGDVIVMVPAETASKPFTFTAPATADDFVLRINKNSDNLKNPGSVVYRVKIVRAGKDQSATGMAEAGGVTVAQASKDQPFVNSLGMKFVPVPIVGGPTDGQRVLFGVWDTRVQDYEAYVQETRREWPKVSFPQGPTLPAVNMNWDDAQAFCQWLTARDQAAGRLPAEWRYRLPSDHEWSCAVGIGTREDAVSSPSEKNGKITDEFPWGTQWPPPKGAGNYRGEEIREAQGDAKLAKLKDVITGYNDGFIYPSPVGSFPANRYGLFDMGGNVWQWCEDWYDDQKQERVTRGASWLDPGPGNPRSSCRNHLRPAKRFDNSGFRCVLSASAR
jgi:formylglycine-generating enzyme required for sulfatase activity